MTKDNLVFGSGVPTAPDVAKLDEQFVDLPEGLIITDEEIEECTGLERTTFRFNTVVGAWRKGLERNRNIILGAVRGQGLKVLDRKERCELGGCKLKTGLRATKRAGNIITKTDKTGLPAETIKAADHVVRLAAIFISTAATEAKKLRYPDPVLQLGK